MSLKNHYRTGGIFVVLSILFGALGGWDTITSHLPPSVRPYAESPVVAIVFALTGVFILWRAAKETSQIANVSASSLRMAQESNQALERRIEQAEAKLIKAIDEQVINWAPAFERLQREAEEQSRRALDGYISELRQVYNSFRRRAEREYLANDDLSKPPPEE
jgi:hypothetical protein